MISFGCGNGRQGLAQAVPKSHETVGFYDEENDNEQPKNDALAHIENAGIKEPAKQPATEAGQDKRKNDDKRRTEKSSANRRQATNDNNDHDLKGSIAVEAGGLLRVKQKQQRMYCPPPH